MAKYPTRKRIYNLVGESHRNEDGSSRQGILKGCVPGEAVQLHRQPRNPHDNNAIFVTDELGRGLGFIARDDASVLAPALDSGAEHSAQIHELVGGVDGFESLGCRICLTWEGQDRQHFKPLGPEQIRFEHAPVHLAVPKTKNNSNNPAEVGVPKPSTWDLLKGCGSLMVLVFVAYLLIRSCTN